MFGIFRFVLAFFVTLYHLGGFHPIGWYAVYGFFALSGYLMTLVMCKKYKLTSGGLISFEFNRVLRIFPAYLLTMVITLIALNVPAIAATASSMEMQPAPGIPSGPWNWFQNIFIYGWQASTPKIMPHCWSIARELVICAMMFFLFARNKWISLAWLGLSLVWGAFTLWKDLPFFYVYLSHKTAMIPYAAGACIYHFWGSLKKWTHPFGVLLPVAIVLPFTNELWARTAFSESHPVIPLFINTALSAYMVLLLSTLRNNGPEWLTRADNFLGNISYPMFLLHPFVGLTTKSAIGGKLGPTLDLFLISIVPLFLLSWLINHYIEQPLVPIRRRTFATAGEFFGAMFGWIKPASRPQPMPVRRAAAPQLEPVVVRVNEPISEQLEPAGHRD